MSLVTVVIPSYNHGQYIKQAVDSVLNQIGVDLELIVVDDGSKDDSINYLRTINDPRFILIEQENSGAHSAINNGLSIAKGDYLTILNSDDVYHPERLVNCMAKFEDGVDLVATWIEVIDHKGKALGIKKGWKNMLPWLVGPCNLQSTTVNEFSLNLLMTNFVSTTSNIVFTRKLYEKIGGMKNLRFVHDWDFLLRAATYFKCELIESPLLQYRVHQTNTISSNRKWMLFEICWIYAVHLKKFTKKMFSNTSLTNGIAVRTEFLSQSINLQGNDKVLWMLLNYMGENDNESEEALMEKLLIDEQLRSAFIRHIVS